MSQKLMPRLGSAIASTILSLAALSVAGVDQVQAAVLTWDFQVEQGGGSGFFNFSNSSLTGIGPESIAVRDGRFNTFATASDSSYGLEGKDFYDLAGAIALFYQGEFRGLSASGGDTATREIDVSEEQGGPFYAKYDSSAYWSIGTSGAIGPGRWVSYFSGYRETLISDRKRVLAIDGRRIINGAEVSYTLVNTEPEPEPVSERVPEPLTAGGTALALAGLSWLKHKKKMAA